VAQVQVSKDAANATNLGRIASFDTASATLQPTQDAGSNIRPQTEMLPTWPRFGHVLTTFVGYTEGEISHQWYI
jgi:hypothetical protein